MPTLRVVTYNVENLFRRAALLNFRNNSTGDPYLVKVQELQEELKKAAYNKPRILSLYREVKDFIGVVEERDRLFDRSKKQVVADGADDWEGFLEFKTERINTAAQKNTGKVLKAVNADIACLIEIESRPTLKAFVSDQLRKTTTFTPYPYFMSIDGNDDRGIDVGIASRWPITELRSHVDDDDGKGQVFSRDCLEVKVEKDGVEVWLLLNHLKSKGYGDPKNSDAKRERQSKQIARILKRYDLAKDNVIVCGDLNDTPGSIPLKPLLSVTNLHDVLDTVQANNRWTYYFKGRQQIDYLLISKPLKNKLAAAGVERRGIHNVAKHTTTNETSFNTVTKPIEAASDHGAVWADFNLGS